MRIRNAIPLTGFGAKLITGAPQCRWLPTSSPSTLGNPSFNEIIEGHRLRCLACGHRCPISAGFAGVCKVRFNRDGKLYAPYGYLNSLRCDPIEKKPFYHVRPSGLALSFGMLGCDLHCAYCQNWITSQALRDARSTTNFTQIRLDQIVAAALSEGADAGISTYNEPLITAEWAVEIFREARRVGVEELTGTPGGR